MAIAGKVGAVYISNVKSPSVDFSSEECVGDEEYKRYKIDNPLFQYWDPDFPVLVEVDEEPVSSGFTIEHVGGFVVFADALDEFAEVTVSGNAFVMVQGGGFFDWTIDGESDSAEVSTFGSEGWKEFKHTLLNWSGSANAFWGNNHFLEALGKIVVLKLFIDAGPSQKCLEGFALINGEGIEVPVDGIVEESIDFTGSGPLYMRG